MIYFVLQVTTEDGKPVLKHRFKREKDARDLKRALDGMNTSCYIYQKRG